MFKKILSKFKTKGISGLVRAVYSRVFAPHPNKASSFATLRKFFQNKTGMEIGGASAVFTEPGLFPIYPIALRVDNCNFGNRTVWEGVIEEGHTFQFDPKKFPGQQYIAEATDLEIIPSANYDFLLSSHVIEHIANPILALTEWVRILKDDGVLVLLLPHKDGTFDHRRPVTTMQHLIEDFNAGMAEDDLTHMPEIMALHDLERDPEAGDFGAFKSRSEKNFENRCFHHHVFDTHLAVSLVDYMGLQILAVEAIRPMHILVLAQKTVNGVLPANSAYLAGSAQYRRASPFKSDHL